MKAAKPAILIAAVAHVGMSSMTATGTLNSTAASA
jgi:hypothetical protein